MPPMTLDERIIVMRAQQLRPVWFVNAILGGHVWSKQAEVMESVRDHPRTAVRSCHGVGKTRIAADIALWFLYSYPKSRVITTAPTAFQMEHLLWREIGSVWSSARLPLDGRKLNTQIDIADDWFAIGLSTDEPERFSGQHADNILVVVDEGSGVSKEIYEAAEGYLTTEGGRLLMIGNPTQNTGQFYDAFHSERKLWNCIHISVFDSPNFTDESCPDDVRTKLTSRAWVEDKKLKWGEKSPMYQVRVLGNFSTTSDNNVFSLADLEHAQASVDYEPKKNDPAVVACDVARFGSDETVISVRHGLRVRIVESYVGKGTEGTFSEKNTVQTANRIIHHAKEVAKLSERFPQIVVDDDGVGGGVTDQIHEQGFQVTPFRGQRTAVDSQEYPNARSELWFQVSERIRGIDLDGDDQLAADLSAPEYKMDSSGRRIVERKDETKKRIGRSPDRGDSVLLTFAPERDAGVETLHYRDEDTGESVYAKGDLVMHGDKYIDRADGEGDWDE